MSGKPGRSGRPPLHPGERKRHNITTRYRDSIRDRLVAAAAENGRSLSEEIEFRLERSFLMDDVGAWLDRRFGPPI